MTNEEIEFMKAAIRLIVRFDDGLEKIQTALGCVLEAGEEVGRGDDV